MTSNPFFPTPQRRRNAEKITGERHTRKQTLAKEMWRTVQREAAFIGISAAGYERDALRRFIKETHAWRTEGRRSLPVPFTDRGYESLIAAANRLRQPLDVWAEHALLAAAMKAAADPAPADNIKEKAAA